MFDVNNKWLIDSYVLDYYDSAVINQRSFFIRA